MRVKDAVGRFGEEVAAAHLERAGLQVLEQNWRCRDGELDLLAVEDGVLVVVEVKTRSTAEFGRPVEAVGPAKAARIRRLAMRWLAEDERYWREIRFDIVGVLRSQSGGTTVEHLRGAF
jgi:putative endonuclease